MPRRCWLPPPPAAWGCLELDASQLHICSYELGVLLLPRLEAAYRTSRWCGFSCTGGQPGAAAPRLAQAAAAAGAAGTAAVPSVRFLQWRQGDSQAAEMVQGQLGVPLPVPFHLPPVPYQLGGPVRDRVWAVDTPWEGLDSWECSVQQPHGRGAHYGLLEQDDWSDAAYLDELYDEQVEWLRREQQRPTQRRRL